MTKKTRPRLVAMVAAGLPAIALVAGCATAGSAATGSAATGSAATGSAATGSAATARVNVAAVARPAARGPSVRTASAAPGSVQAVSATTNGSRRVTFINKVQRTIWLAASPDASHPMARTGWKLRPRHRVTVTVPNHWNGRFWGRTGCVFRDGRGHCETGDCDGKFQCAGFGAIPATLAEYDLDAWDGLDFYDVSMVDGANLPMYIHPTSGQAAKRVGQKGCIPAGCTRPVRCPRALKIDVHGKYVACESACAKIGGDQYCCRGAWAPRADCNPKKWPVDYARVFKRAEPYAYSYVDDDATSTYVCQGRCNYQIIFGITPRK